MNAEPIDDRPDDSNTPEVLEHARHVEIGKSLLLRNTGNCLIAYTGPEGEWAFVTSNRTWAMGAARRVQLALDEEERRDSKERGLDHG